MSDFVLGQILYPQLRTGQLPDELSPAKYFNFKEEGFPEDPMAVWAIGFTAGYIRAVEMLNHGRAELADEIVELRKALKALETEQSKTG